MKRSFIPFAVALVLLCFAPQAHANVSSVYYQNDPGYASAFRSEAGVGFAILFAYLSVMFLLVRGRSGRGLGGRMLTNVLMIGATLFLLAVGLMRFGGGTGGANFMAGDRPPESPENQAKGIRTWGRVNTGDPPVLLHPTYLGGALAVVCVVGGAVAIPLLKRRWAAHQPKEALRRWEGS